MDWPEVSREILLALDVQREYEALGVQFNGAAPSHSGWVPCHAIGREDNNPSAAVNIGQDPNLRGRYKDHGGDGISLTLWDFAAQFGPYADWRAAREHYGHVAGLKSRFPKSPEKTSLDSFQPRATQPDPAQFDLYVQNLVARYPGISERSLRLCGARYGKYPAKSPHPQWCVGLPTFGAYLFDGGIRGWQIAAVDGGPVLRYRGKDAPPQKLPRMTLGNDGLMGEHGLRLMQGDQDNGIQPCQHVLKVGGFTDLLSAQELLISAGVQDQVAVVSCAGEGDRYFLTDVAPLFAGRCVYIIHDRDSAGEIGAKAWCKGLKEAGAMVYLTNLPLPRRENHGLDLRDWMGKVFGTGG